MTDEEKVANGRNSRASQHIRRLDIETIVEKHEPLIKTAEEKLQDISGNFLRSPDPEQSIYQVDVAEDAATTTTPAPGDADATSASAAPADADATVAPAATSAPAAPGDDSAESTVTEPATEATPTEDQPPDTEAPTIEGAPEASQEQGEPEPGQEPTSVDADVNKPNEMEDKPEGEGGVKTTEADGDKPTEGTTDQTSTVEPQVKDPYRIDIPLEKKINKRTQRKLWEEIEKRKPLIPKYVERHIQKYAKPPFELWGCKFRGKGSCYGCGG